MANVRRVAAVVLGMFVLGAALPSVAVADSVVADSIFVNRIAGDHIATTSVAPDSTFASGIAASSNTDQTSDPSGWTLAVGALLPFLLLHGGGGAPSSLGGPQGGGPVFSPDPVLPQTPEPSTWLLISSALPGVAGVLIRRRRKGWLRRVP